LIVLFGATYAYANQSVYTEGLELSASRLSQSFREVLALKLMTIISGRFRAGEEPLNAEDLGEQIGAPISLVHRVLDVLETHNVVRETEGAKSGEGGYLPAQSLQELTVEQIVAVLRDKEGSDFGLSQRPEFAEATRILREGEAACREVLAKTSLRSLTDEEPQAAQAE
jgi:DNA-binding IscR family transcriptional regulator